MSREDKRRGEREERRTRTSERRVGADRETRTSPKQFLREVRSELRKVAWPNRKEVRRRTPSSCSSRPLVLVGIVWGMDFMIREAVINTLG
jgi:preprotein translocase subunit SecE